MTDKMKRRVFITLLGGAAFDASASDSPYKAFAEASKPVEATSEPRRNRATSRQATAGQIRPEIRRLRWDRETRWKLIADALLM
jgi:hypothetical protein